MACRLRNTGTHPLVVDLRGGEVLYLAPGQTSRALREELLYDNSMLADWQQRGLVARESARMSEVIAQETPRPPVAAKKPERGAPEPEPEAEESDGAESGRARPEKHTSRKRGGKPPAATD